MEDVAATFLIGSEKFGAGVIPPFWVNIDDISGWEWTTIEFKL